MERNLPIVQAPQCIIYTRDKALEVNQDVLDQLRALGEKPMVVVAIAGLYRTGKSYLMNRLAGTSAGFALGATIQSHTKGIWIWVRPHPKLPNTNLVLLDTEGLGDAEKGNANHDNWIFTLATLLSSALVYNYLGVINDDMITKLSFIAEIAQKIKMRESDMEGSDTDFDLHFPLFIMALRDFTLELEINGQSVTADQYLEYLLNIGQDQTPDFIESRRCIRKYFKSRRCFTFDRPASRSMLKNLETIGDNDLVRDFLEDSLAFTNYVYSECPVMKLPNGTKINGSMYASLIQSYINAIKDGAMPCVENAYMTMANEQNRQAVEGSIMLYEKEMEALVKPPTETEKELADINMACQQKAITYFSSRAIMDQSGHFHRRLNEMLLEKYLSYDKSNKEISKTECTKILNLLMARINQKLQDGGYLKSGGYAEYCQDLETLKTSYGNHKGLGLEKERTMDEFLNNASPTSAAILAADEKMTEEEKKLGLMEEEARKLERQRKHDEEEILHLQQVAQDKQRVLEETQKQMEEKHQQEMIALQKQQEEIQAKRMQEQERLLREGFQKEAEAMRREVEDAKRQFAEEQRYFEQIMQRERAHNEEMLALRLQEQQKEHEHLLQLEQQKNENRAKEDQIKYLNEQAREAKEAREELISRMERMSQQQVDAMEKMQADNLRLQQEQQQALREMEMKRLQQDMERDRQHQEALRQQREEQEERAREERNRAERYRVERYQEEKPDIISRGFMFVRNLIPFKLPF